MSIELFGELVIPRLFPLLGCERCKSVCIKFNLGKLATTDMNCMFGYCLVRLFLFEYSPVFSCNLAN